MRKGDALVNAQSVFSWAVLFDHGRLHKLANLGNSIELNVSFPYDQYDLEREDELYRSVVMAGAEIKWGNRPGLHRWILKIEWHYSK